MLSETRVTFFDRNSGNDVNPHYFTVDVDADGNLEFFQGKRPIIFPPVAVKALINSDDFYGNTSNLLKIAQHPEEFADELVSLLRQSGRYARVEKATFEDAVFSGYFVLDLDNLDLKIGPHSKGSRIYKDHDFYAYVTPHNLDFQSIFDTLAAAYDRAYTNDFYVPVLD